MWSLTKPFTEDKKNKNRKNPELNILSPVPVSQARDGYPIGLSIPDKGCIFSLGEPALGVILGTAPALL